MVRYESQKPPRFRKEVLPGGYEFVIPARKNWFAIPFLVLWLAGWTAGGAAALFSLIRDGEAFLYIWLAFWALAWIFAFSQLAFMLAGAEFIRCINGDVEIGYRAFLYGKTWRYRGAEISGLAATDGPDMLTRMFTWGGSMNPIYAARRIGTVRFNHGARTIYAGNALDRAEAEIIVADLCRSLPNSR